MEEEAPKSVKVIDRRWFASDGTPRRHETEAPTGVTAAAGPSPQAAPPPPSAMRVGFVDLVDALAQPALAYLSGQVPGRGRDPEAARDYIDLLAVVRDRTEGNLAPEERRYLDDVVYQLESLYLSAPR